MRTLLLATTMLLPAAAAAQAPERGTRPVAAATDAARIAPREAGWQGATQLFAYAPGGLYQVYAAVGRVTDIVLQEGESLSDTGAVAAGDTVRWVIGEAASGTGPTRRVHILVKPTDPGLITNLVINTDRRTYHVELRSTPSTYMASVGWSYPQDELIAIEARQRAAEQVAATRVQAGIEAASLDFAYRLRGANPPWRPTQVFDDGAKTYILFPETIAQSELPPLFLIGERNQAELVNYRFSGRYMIVDRLFERAEFRLGTRRQEIVRIERTRARERQQ
ncbi:P-type conjugative transfer protein TrbG [Rhizorhabdus wittichii RW1]|uniref:P-type conjugative transfer protein TrbG n=1 Tax=Rhizorhabdus wittichii (strain DSM 6014 / CCUG 31198 / JCM 15750 / NBRC 105917 / EY 4224 / RW1) TaxID=392499 RepID=A0A9J9H7T0_RHIWR|nr:P-type conjugative transfer protein TrbG [Rhizorhabdus wittichii RW1]